MLLPNVSTSIIILELRNRIGDRLHDPEPQYDVVLSDLSRGRLEVLESVLESISLYNVDTEEN